MSEMTIYRCPCCRGEISFNSDQQKLVCPYCDTSFEIETLEQYNNELNKKLKNKMDWNKVKKNDTFEDQDIIVYTCKNCGGQIVGDINTIATSCPYCDSPVVLDENVTGQFIPDYIIPFQFDKEDAKKKLYFYFNDKNFVSRAFKKESSLDEIKGIYVPFWIYHCQANISQQYRTTKNRYYSDHDYDYTETKHYLSLREGTIQFDNVPVDGSSKISDEYMQSLEPFDFSQAVEFRQAYLAGYFADKYDEDAQSSEKKVNKRIQNTSKEMFKLTVSHFSSADLEKSQIELENKQIDYYLLPVWILNITWNKETYVFMMNGQTGKMIGDVPTDMKLFWRYVAIVTFVVGFVVLIFLQVMN